MLCAVAATVTPSSFRLDDRPGGGHPDAHALPVAHGIGITGVGSCMANPIYNATRKRVRDLPITLDKLS